MTEPPDFIHWLWNAVLTVLGALLMLFIKDNKEKLDKKADKEVVDLKLENLMKDIKSIKELGEIRTKRMEQHHSENTEKLDNIIRELRIR